MSQRENDRPKILPWNYTKTYLALTWTAPVALQKIVFMELWKQNVVKAEIIKNNLICFSLLKNELIVFILA